MTAPTGRVDACRVRSGKRDNPTGWTCLPARKHPARRHHGDKDGIGTVLSRPACGKDETAPPAQRPGKMRRQDLAAGFVRGRLAAVFFAAAFFAAVFLGTDFFVPAFRGAGFPAPPSAFPPPPAGRDSRRASRSSMRERRRSSSCKIRSPPSDAPAAAWARFEPAASCFAFCCPPAPCCPQAAIACMNASIGDACGPGPAIRLDVKFCQARTDSSILRVRSGSLPIAEIWDCQRSTKRRASSAGSSSGPSPPPGEPVLLSFLAIMAGTITRPPHREQVYCTAAPTGAHFLSAVRSATVTNNDFNPCGPDHADRRGNRE